MKLHFKSHGSILNSDLLKMIFGFALGKGCFYNVHFGFFFFFSQIIQIEWLIEPDRTG